MTNKLLYLILFIASAIGINFATYQYNKKKVIDLGSDSYGNSITMICDDYKDNIKNGNCSKYVNGNLFSTCSYVDNLENGSLNIYRDNSLSSTQSFKMGLKHGYAIVYKESRSSIISRYENDLLEGASKTIEDGLVKQEVIYLHNEPQIIKDFDDDSNLTQITTFYQDDKSKILQYEYDNELGVNRLLSISNYHNSHYEGVQQNFSKGRLCDEFWYDSDGKKIRHIQKNCLEAV